MTTQMPRYMLAAYPEMAVSGFSRVDGTVQFYLQINALLQANSVVLDFGAGRGAGFAELSPLKRNLRLLRGRAGKVIGADVDPVVKTNPSLDEAIVLKRDGTLPLADSSVDIIIADFVFEHIPEPSVTAPELIRVLRPEGWLCVRTPNRWGYVATANRLVPASLKQQLLRGAQPDREERDVFPAYYRLNSRSALARYFPGLRCACYSLDAEPGYHAGSVVLFHLFRAVHLLTPPSLRTTLLAFLQKPLTP